MSATLPLSGPQRFWPPADELTEATERIRARLGDWPTAPGRWRICLQAPETPGSGDLIVAAGPGAAPAAVRSAWLTGGAGVIETAPAGVTLGRGEERWALEGERAEDWLPALAAFLDCGFAPPDALTLALAWRDGDERQLDDPWPIDLARFPRVAGLPPAPPRPFAPCPARLGLYPVVPDADWIERVLGYGVKTVQLRRKTAEPDALAREIARSVVAARRHDALLFVNDHWRAALAAGAYGVHLGQEDLFLPGLDLAALAEAGLRLGLSTHGYYEILTALHFRPSYVAFGPVFGTSTKQVAAPPQGLARLRRYVQLLDGVVPHVAIGGIDAAALPEVLASGVGSAAVIGAVTGAVDPAAAVAGLLRTFTQ